jgi:general secretion pathway protein G
MLMFKNDCKRLPTQEEGIAALWDKGVLSEEIAGRWAGPYLEQAIPKDMWGHEWVYVTDAEGTTAGFDIVSVGPDGQEGTDDDISLAKGKGNAEGDMDSSSGSSSSSSSGAQ